jgi:protein-tyrosine phosphatase
MGNICRSPMAEGVFRHLVIEAGIEENAAGGIICDSAGTAGYHVGDPPDPRTVQTAAQYGVDLSGQHARKLQPQDFEIFDHLLAMDEDNLSGMMQLCPPDLRPRIALFMDYAPGLGLREVPDPYYGGQEGFEYCYELVREAAEGLLGKLTGT